MSGTAGAYERADNQRYHLHWDSRAVVGKENKNERADPKAMSQKYLPG